MSWNPETEIDWSLNGYTDQFDGHNGSYMNFGTGTKITAAVETATANADLGTNQELFAVIGTFQADTGGGAQAANASTGADV